MATISQPVAAQANCQDQSSGRILRTDFRAQAAPGDLAYVPQARNDKQATQGERYIAVDLNNRCMRLQGYGPHYFAIRDLSGSGARAPFINAISVSERLPKNNKLTYKIEVNKFYVEGFSTFHIFFKENVNRQTITYLVSAKYGPSRLLSFTIERKSQ